MDILDKQRKLIIRSKDTWDTLRKTTELLDLKEKMRNGKRKSK